MFPKTDETLFVGIHEIWSFVDWPIMTHPGPCRTTVLSGDLMSTVERGEGMENAELFVNSSKSAGMVTKKLRTLTGAERDELFRIDKLIEQLNSGAFCQGLHEFGPTNRPDVDHPYYERYTAMDNQRQKRLRAAAKRKEFSGEMVQQEHAATQKLLHLTFAVPFTTFITQTC
jgi:hypothetical protein